MAAERGLVQLAFRHRVDELLVEHGRVVGVSGAVLARSLVGRGQASSREVVGRFQARAGAVLVSSGGIGGNLELVRRYWPERLGPAPRDMVAGVPASTDGRMLEVSERAGASWIGRDRMWHYTEGIRNWNPIWENHGIRILPGAVLDVVRRNRQAPAGAAVPRLRHGRARSPTSVAPAHDHTWFVLNRRIIAREFALSGSEQNPDITGKDVEATVRSRLLPEVPGTDPGLPGPRRGLRRCRQPARAGGGHERARPTSRCSDYDDIERQIVARDREVANPFGKDLQLMAIRAARRYLPDRVSRVVAPHRILDPAAGPLIAVKLHILTRKTLGGLATDLEARVLGADGEPLDGLWAAGETAGFGGGGMHGYSALEGTFLGGCLFSGRQAGRSMAARL